MYLPSNVSWKTISYIIYRIETMSSSSIFLFGAVICSGTLLLGFDLSFK